MKQILCDITLVTGFDAKEVSVMTRFETGELVAKSLPRDFKVAVLETSQQIVEGIFGENVMTNRGAVVKVISSLDEALRWLGVTSGDNSAGVDITNKKE